MASSYRHTSVPQETQSRQGQGPRFVIGIDYGTTYTGSAWAIVTDQAPTLADINVVQVWPDGNDPKVPSLYTYETRPGTRQWGFGISNNRHVIRMTKLRLQKRSRLETLETLKSYLDEVKLTRPDARPPPHLLKTPLDTMTDFLIEVAKCVRKNIEGRVDAQLLERAPIDLIITHPALWDERAKNATFRAAAEAFKRAMPDFPARVWSYRLTSEAEACAQYTMQVAESGIEDLRMGECFVVVDAGGGTVDLISYKVRRMGQEFQVREATKPSSARCGATRIDEYFIENFLPDKLGEELDNLRRSDNERTASGGSHDVLQPAVQMMLEQFQAIKHNFGKPTENDRDVLPLPDGIDEVDDPGRNIQDGQLFITSENMKAMFDRPVDTTKDLIKQQLEQIARKNLRVKTIFLSGGFSRSEYLYQQVCELASGPGISVVRAEGQDHFGSWTAVARGAVIIGLNLGCKMPPAVEPCPFHIGLVLSERFAAHAHAATQQYTSSFDGTERAKESITWLIRKGDLVAPEAETRRTIQVVTKATTAGRRPGSMEVVFSRDDNPLGPPSRVSADVVSRTLDYDLSALPYGLWELAPPKTPNEKGGRYRLLKMELVVSVNPGRIDLHLECKAGVEAGSSVGVLKLEVGSIEFAAALSQQNRV